MLHMSLRLDTIHVLERTLNSECSGIPIVVIVNKINFISEKHFWYHFQYPIIGIIVTGD